MTLQMLCLDAHLREVLVESKMAAMRLIHNQSDIGLTTDPSQAYTENVQSHRLPRVFMIQSEKDQSMSRYISRSTFAQEQLGTATAET